MTPARPEPRPADLHGPERLGSVRPHVLEDLRRRVLAALRDVGGEVEDDPHAP